MKRRLFLLHSAAAWSLGRGFAFAEQETPRPGNPPDRPKMVVSGFEPFQGRKVNASFRLATYMGEIPAPRWEVAVIQVPVIWGEPAKVVEAHWPGPGGLWLAFGEGSPEAIRIETTALNRRASTPDNDHALPAADEIDPSGPDDLQLDYPVAPLLDKIKAAGFAARVSHDAGRYLCEELFYDLLRKQRKTRKTPHPATTLFIHVPPWGSRVTSGEAAPAKAEEAYFRKLAGILMEALT